MRIQSLCLAVFIIVFLASCQNKSPRLTATGLGISQVASCGQDNRICPDGSIVGRVSPGCDFSACPSSDDSFCDYGSPKRDYRGKTPEECAKINVQCTTGQKFSDHCGCGCTAAYTPPDLSNSKTTNTP